MTKCLLSLILVITIAFSFPFTIFAHSRNTHDEELEYVLFRNRHYKESHPRDKDKIIAIEKAMYLCIDQFNGDGKDDLQYLIETAKIPDLPTSINEFDYSSNYSHRSLTHRGWSIEYDQKAHWPIRQRILRNTVKKLLFSSIDNSLISIPLIGERIYSYKGYDLQCENFCVLIYCIHVLGDHIEAGEDKKEGNIGKPKTLKEKTTGLAYILPLVQPNDRDNPGLIPSIISSCEVVFSSQKNTENYKHFMQELEELKSESGKVYGSTGGVNTDEEFDKYNACANNLLETLALYVPGMLEKEEFFSSSFN